MQVFRKPSMNEWLDISQQETRRMVFFHPAPLLREANRASAIRPFKMWKAFEQSGFQVDVVSGNYSERKLAASRVKSRANYQFLYYEIVNTPLLISNRWSFYQVPIADYRFLRWFKKHCGPIGIFYRDVYWRFPEYAASLGPIKSTIGRLFHTFDDRFFANIADVIFLPSERMREHISPWLKNCPTASLPPGVEMVEGIQTPQRRGDNFINLIYVGSALPPYYDLTPLFNIVSRLSFLKLQVVTREDEWRKQQERYQDHLNDRVRISHEEGEAIKHRYDVADCVIVHRREEEYLSFAMPYKIFEALSHGRKLLLRSGSSAADFVVNNRVGWKFSDENELEQLLRSLRNNPKQLAMDQQQLDDLRREHSWPARAQQVARNMKHSMSTP